MFERGSPPSAWRLGVCAFFVFAPIGVQMPFFSPWLSARGFTPEGIALLLGIAPLVRFASNLAVPPVADRTGDAARVLLVCALAAAAAQAVSGLPQGIVWIFALSLLATAGQGPTIPLLETIILRESRRRVLDGEAALDYGAIRSAGSASVLILMLASGWFAAVTPPTATIWLIAATSGAAVLAVWLCLGRAKLAPPPPDAAIIQGPVGRLGLVALVVAASSAVQASHAIIYAFGSIGWRRAGFSDEAIGLLWACGVATEIVLFFFARRVTGASPYAYLVAGALVAVVRWAAMAFDPGPALLTLLQTLHAGSFAATYLGAVLAIAALAPEHRRAQIQGRASGANALLLAAATMVSGRLWDRFGVGAYGAMALLALVGLLCAVLAALLSPKARARAET